VVSHRLYILCLILALFSSSALAGKYYHYDYQKSVNVEPGLEMTVNNPNGNVTIITNNEYKLKVEAVKHIYAESKDEADLVGDHVQINVTATEGHFTIEPHFLTMRDRSESFWQKLFGKSGEQAYGSIDFVISVPVDCNAEVFTTAGKIDVAGIRGNVSLSGTSGEIAVRDNQGSLDITATSGQVALNDITGNIKINAAGSTVRFFSINGDLEAHTSAGTFTGEYLIGDLTVTKTTGVVELDHIEGDVRIKSVSGNISIKQDFGAVDVYNESGDINIRTELNSEKDYLVETIAGSIRFMIPDVAGGEVNMLSGSGNIDTQIPISIDSFSRDRISGTFGQGGPKISLETTSGNITLAEF